MHVGYFCLCLSDFLLKVNNIIDVNVILCKYKCCQQLGTSCWVFTSWHFFLGRIVEWFNYFRLHSVLESTFTSCLQKLPGLVWKLICLTQRWRPGILPREGTWKQRKDIFSFRKRFPMKSVLLSPSLWNRN